MLVPNLRPKAVLPHGPRLLPGFIVRFRGRLVAGKPSPEPTPSRPTGPPLRKRGPYAARHTRPPVAPLPQRARLLALCLGSPWRILLPEPLFPEPVQPKGARPLESEMRAFQEEAFAEDLSEPSAV